MKNKNVGFLIVGIAVVIGIIVLLFNLGLRSIAVSSCSHGSSCVMYGTIAIQTYIGLALALLVFFIGLFLIFSKESERVIVKRVQPYGKLRPRKFDEKSLKGLKAEEKKIMNLLLESKGALFQSEIVERSGFGKVKVTRILDLLEGQGFVERRRRGMSNVVILKR